VVITIWVAYAVAAVAACGIFIVVGWRSRTSPGDGSPQAGYRVAADPLWSEAELDLSEARPRADAGAAIRLALKRLAPAMAAQSIRVEVAAASGLMVRMRGAALADLLEEMLVATIHAAPAGRILLSAKVHGEGICISITDDVPGADPDVRRAGIRVLMERVAMRGGALDVDVRPAEGTTMTLRLAAAGEDQDQDQDQASTEPAKGKTPPLVRFSFDTTR
jgi:hypothetical protein